MKSSHSILLVTAASLVLLLSSCSDSNKDKEKVSEVQLDKMYSDAMQNLEKSSFKDAAEQFEKIEQEQPYSKWAAQAQMMAAYAYYRNEKHDEAITVIDRFIKLHPGHKDIAYMYYLKSLSYYDQITDVKRDQKISEYALASLREVVARFPETVYARDAKIKVDLVNDHLAGKEMEVGRFYVSKGKVIAGLNRFQSVVERYQTTSHVPEALYRITASYMHLGVLEEARKNAAVLGHNYPTSKWYRMSYELVNGKVEPAAASKASWFQGLTDKLKKK